MRPIDADALNEKLEDTWCKDCTDAPHRWACLTCIITSVMTYVDGAPTLDVAPVVLCKDCKESEECRAWVGDDYCYCNVWDTVVRCNGFCDHGAKMDEKEG